MDFLNVAGLSYGLTQSNRAIRLRSSHSQSTLDDVLFVKRVCGREMLCGGIEYTLPLKEFIALPAQVQFVTDRGELRCVCGIVSEVSAGQSDGGLASYQLTVRDALGLMDRRVNTRIFRSQNEVDISAALIREWRGIAPILAEVFDLDTSGITGSYPAREFTMQHNESDAAFLRRLWKRRGIAWFIRPGQATQSGKRGHRFSYACAVRRAALVQAEFCRHGALSPRCRYRDARRRLQLERRPFIEIR